MNGRTPIRLLSILTTLVMLLANFGQAWAAVDLAPAASVQADQGDPQYFSQTGFRIDNAAFWSYFNARGGIANFGYPVSRTFTFQGSTVQFFQRRIVEINPNGSVGQLNLLDPGLMPYTSVNGATFPASDPNFTKAAPSASAPNYGSAILAWIQSVAPNTVGTFAVNFFSTFQNTVSMSTAYPTGGGNAGLLEGIDLEMWGVPLSAPAADPHNGNFIYQRWQRGVMHFDATSGTTQGILLADYFKSIITGTNLPADLAAEAKSSPYYLQYDKTKPKSLSNPSKVFNTDMTNAFEVEAPIPTSGTPAPAPVPTGTTGFHYGFQAQYLEGSIPQIVGAVTGAGFNYTKQQVRWVDVEPSNGSYNWGALDTAVNTANSAGVGMLFSIVSAPAWAASPGTDFPKNPQDFANLMTAMAGHFKGRVKAYELWNEENFAREVGPGNINAGNYVELLKLAYPAVKAADPSAIVVSGAPTPTGVNDPNIAERDITYLQQMYGYQNGVVKSYFDVLGAHNEPYWNPPTQTVATATNTSYANDPSFFFRQVEDYHNLMVSVGDGNKQIWETEIGYDANTMAPAGYSGWTVSDQQQATYLVQLFQYARSNYPWMGAIFVWNLNFQCIGLSQSDEKWGFSVLAAGYTPRPAYSALQAMPKV